MGREKRERKRRGREKEREGENEGGIERRNMVRSHLIKICKQFSSYWPF